MLEDEAGGESGEGLSAPERALWGGSQASQTFPDSWAGLPARLASAGDALEGDGPEPKKAWRGRKGSAGKG